jgi:hypothetical protein
MRRPTIRALVGGAAGIAAGIAGGVALTSLPAASLPPTSGSQALEVAHVPPVLRAPGEPVTLRYAIVCAPREDGEPCRGSGEVYVRAGQSGSYDRLELRRGEDSEEGRYYVDLPPRIAASPDGFSYYAVLHDEGSRTAATVPSGGAAAPQRSFPLGKPVHIDLGAHAFGHARTRDARVVAAPWGSDAGEAGLAGTRELGYVGPSSFDVSSDGSVTLLDQVNARVEWWLHGRASTTPVTASGGIADFAVEPDGSFDVLEPPNRTTTAPVLRHFRRDGAVEWVRRLADRTWAKLALGPDGAVVQQQPSEEWLPVAVDGRPLGRVEQAARGRPGLPTGHGREVLVARVGSGELRLAEVAGNAVLAGWQITSTTPLGEVQLAEPLGSGLVVVVKTYTDDRDEFLALVLDRSGVSQRFSVTSAEWAETAPLARFRLAGSSLYELGSTASGAFVDRFDLEVPR